MGNNSSNIIKNKEEYNMIIKWFSPKKVVELKKIYSCSKIIKWTSEDFHENCDKKNNVMVLIKSEAGHRLGGYISTCFTDMNEPKKDPNAFLFNLNENEKYPIKTNYDAITCNNDRGPDFFDLCICNNYFNVEKSFLNLNNESHYVYPNNYLSKGIEYFLVEELEVFKVIFEKI